MKEFNQPACVIVKHTNPCGTATADTLQEAYERAFAADSLSAFGGIIALNRVVDEATAAKIAEPFMEVVIAPGYEEKALNRLCQKKNLRVLQMDIEAGSRLLLRSVDGGFVVQEADTAGVDESEPQFVTQARPTESQMKDLMFAWKLVKHVKSNAIVTAKDGVTLGVGAGQMNRVGAAAIALQDKEKCQGAVLASDAFFPFRDTVDLAAAHGIKAIIQPGGSIRDQESIDACNEHGIAMVFTGQRHFRH